MDIMDSSMEGRGEYRQLHPQGWNLKLLGTCRTTWDNLNDSMSLVSVKTEDNHFPRIILVRGLRAFQPIQVAEKFGISQCWC
jgi:hypothetical protein